MRIFTPLACSFCGRTASEVAKLAGGPRVYICDACVAEAQRVMNDPDALAGCASATPTLWQRIVSSLARLRRGGQMPRALRRPVQSA